MNALSSLQQLGWSPFFSQQLTLEELEANQPARIARQHKSRLELMSDAGELTLDLLPSMPALTVGDWLLLDAGGKFLRLLDRLSLFQRRAAGSKVDSQLIAANVDTAFIVSSLNQDFNLSRIERYLALVNEAGAEPVVVLTKKDLCTEVEDKLAELRGVDPLLMVEAVNGLDAGSVEALLPWCGTGRTVLFLGSSGVGKSTLVNTLAGISLQHTAGIREDDGKGKHTTTDRSLHRLPSGGLLLDTPGMRELQLADVEAGLEQTFAEISALAEQCRFADCQHQSEPGCAVQAALASGAIDERRLANYRKLLREQALNSATLAEKRSRDKALGKYYRSVLSESRRRKEDR